MKQTEAHSAFASVCHRTCLMTENLHVTSDDDDDDDVASVSDLCQVNNIDLCSSVLRLKGRM